MKETKDFNRNDWTETTDAETVTCAEMKEIERMADAAGLSYYQMMENAGLAAGNVILSQAEKNESAGTRRAVVFCGKGNNGGDGYVAARILSEAGLMVTVVTAEGPAATKDAAANARLAAAMKLPILSWPGGADSSKCRFQAETIHAAVSAADIIVDAIYGTGFHGELSDSVRRCTCAINAQKSRAVICALDIPSGLAGDSGQAADGAVRADCTIVFHRRKPVHGVKAALPYCGRIITVGIGID